ncbi:hypothetical protein IP91_02492 [Pseudoduganella lurida]|uniref:Uncharacterized protein n=1 Tax=Pseudoduganella lurida TaxID=1036180 RepID=A0A562R7P7_9BURK|nr:hypothetical protein [Pseudoduganella lurida]TWI65087.1 hypothetical protein IP91_02492 [Pseudoduganella lurida]
MDERFIAAARAQECGDHAAALRILRAIEADERAASPGLAPPSFGLLFQWGQLAKEHAPAYRTLAALRDEHVARLKAGDIHSGQPDFAGHPRSRFPDIASLNHALGDSRSTYEVFVYMAGALPDEARREASSRAIEPIVEQGDFELAARYLPEPARWIQHLNEEAREGLAALQPVFSPQWSEQPLPARPGRAAMQLSATLSNYVTDVRHRAAILAGLGRHAEAAQARADGLAGIESDQLRVLAALDLAEPGTISRRMVDWEMRVMPRDAATPRSNPQ